MKTTQRQSSWSPCRGAGATQRKNRHGGYGLQVLVAVLMLLVGRGSPARAQSYITDVMVLGVSGGLNAKNLRNEWQRQINTSMFASDFT